MLSKNYIIIVRRVNRTRPYLPLQCTKEIIFTLCIVQYGGRNSVVVIKPCYGLNGPRIESWWRCVVQTDPEAHPAACKRDTGTPRG